MQGSDRRRPGTLLPGSGVHVTDTGGAVTGKPINDMAFITGQVDSVNDRQDQIPGLTERVSGALKHEPHSVKGLPHQILLAYQEIKAADVAPHHACTLVRIDL